MAISEKTGLRKRQQISKAGKTVFLWVAGASVIVGFCLVGGWFLLQKGMYNAKVLGEKSKTLSALEHNNRSVNELKDNIRALNTNAQLGALRVNDDRAVQVVLDALPADANSLALGASLQNKLLAGEGVTVESLSVTPVSGVESSSDSTGTADELTTNDDSTTTVSFSAVVSGDAAVLKQVLERLERSIRAINLTRLTLESSGSKLTLTIQGHAYYEPAKSVELQEKVVRP